MTEHLQKDRAFKVVIFTAFLDVLGVGLIIPILPSLIRQLAATAERTNDVYGLAFLHFFSQFSSDPSALLSGVVFSLFSLGMLFWGIFFGSLSDRIGRKKTLLFTAGLAVVGYLCFGLSESLTAFIVGRFISGLAGGGFPVTQAYLSDLFEPKERAVKMGMIGAAFGAGFTIGPVLWGFLSNYGFQTVGLVSAAIMAIDFLLILFVLPEPHHHKPHVEKTDDAADGKPVFPMRELLPLYLVGFVTAFGFSGMQATFGLLLPDRFSVDAKVVGYALGCVGIMSILFQGYLIRFVRSVLLEKGMAIFGLFIMTIAFALFSINPFLPMAFVLAMLFPIGFWSVNVATSALISRIAPDHAGRALGTNGSAMSLANVFWPILAGSLYSFHSVFTFTVGFWTYAACAVIFAIAIPIAFFGISSHHPIFAVKHAEKHEETAA